MNLTPLYKPLIKIFGKAINKNTVKRSNNEVKQIVRQSILPGDVVTPSILKDKILAARVVVNA